MEGWEWLSAYRIIIDLLGIYYGMLLLLLFAVQKTNLPSGMCTHQSAFALCKARSLSLGATFSVSLV
jgi:hypothetical protein